MRTHDLIKNNTLGSNACHQAIDSKSAERRVYCVAGSFETRKKGKKWKGREMELKAITIVMGLVLIFSSQKLVEASFKSYYGECVVDYLDEEAKIECATKCVFKCLILKITQPDSLHYCNFGCSIHLCAKFGNDADKVDRCVHNCKKITCNLQH